jgi:hypothetical protein
LIAEIGRSASHQERFGKSGVAEFSVDALKEFEREACVQEPISRDGVNLYLARYFFER